LLTCDSHNFMFMHIQRTGGTSIRNLCHELSLKTKEKEFFHSHVNNLEDMSILSKYQTFTFVRNPWDRIFSWYQFLMQYSGKQRTINFEDYVLNFEENNRSKNEKLDFIFNQYDYIYKDNEKLIDHIGKFENYSDDVVRIFSKFNITVTSIPKVNDTKRKEYQDYYNLKTASYIEEKCYKDIEHFNYKY